MEPDTLSLVLEGGTVIDGTGAPGRRADLGIAGRRIAAIGDLSGRPARARIDVSGLAVAPGFIDVHTHDDRALLATPEMPAKVSQGVTTVVTGNCGVSLAPVTFPGAPPPPFDLLADQAGYRFDRFADYVAALEAAPPACNTAPLVGHTSLRAAAMDRLDRAATKDEIAAMTARLEEALTAGAIGLSTGLYYEPAQAAPTEEVIALAHAVHRHGGLYTTHMRDEADRVLESIDEACRIGREAAMPVIISHHKVAGKRNHGRSRETLARIEAARQTQSLALDVYPYAASSTVLTQRNAENASRVIVTWSKAMPEMAGRDLQDIARDLGVDQRMAVERLLPAGAIYFAMDEADVSAIIARPYAMIGSDGLPHDAHPHPRLWGSFPRVLGHYARERGLMPLEDAVHRMTGLSAERFGFADRGVLRDGAFADVTVFDPATVADTATFAAPTTPAAGIAYVFVNGACVWRQGAPTGLRPGRVLRRQAA